MLCLFVGCCCWLVCGVCCLCFIELVSVVHCLLRCFVFVVIFVLSCVLFVVCCVLCVVCCVLFVVRCVLFVLLCVLICARWVLFVVCGAMSVAWRCWLFVVLCVMFVL